MPGPSQDDVWRCGPVPRWRVAQPFRAARTSTWSTLCGLWTYSGSPVHDLRHSLRSLARQPGLTVTLLLTIALGIGSNAAVFGFVRGLVTPALPVAEIDTVVSLFTRDTHRMLAPVSYAGYLSVKASTGVFESIGAARESRVRGTDRRPDDVLLHSCHLDWAVVRELARCAPYCRGAGVGAAGSGNR